MESDKKIIVGKLYLTDHPTVATLQVGLINGHKVVVGRHYDDGVLGFFIPDGCKVSDTIAEEMWLKGRLAGNQKNRVKARDMQGVFSEGLFYGSRYFTEETEWMGSPDKIYHDSPRWKSAWVEGSDITDELSSEIF